MRELKIGRSTIKVWPEYLEVHFEDGAKISACANYDPGSVAMAEALGYGTGPDAPLWMARHHDILHVLVAIAEGKPYSMALWCLAHEVAAKRGTISGEDMRAFAAACLINNHANPDYPPSLLSHLDVDDLIGQALALFDVAYGDERAAA